MTTSVSLSCDRSGGTGGGGATGSAVFGRNKRPLSFFSLEFIAKSFPVSRDTAVAALVGRHGAGPKGLIACTIKLRINKGREGGTHEIPSVIEVVVVIARVDQ